MLHPYVEIGFNKIKRLYDRHQVLVGRAARIFQNRLLAGLHADQPVKALLAEVRDLRRHTLLIGRATRTAQAAKNIADFADQELQGREPLVKPSNECEARKTRCNPRKREFGGYLHALEPVAAGGGGRDDSDEERDYPKPECGNDRN